MDLIAKGGIVMVLIIMLSIVAAAIIIERFLFFRRTRVDEAQLIGRLRTALEKGHFDEALAICEHHPEAPIASLMRVGIQHRHRDPRTAREMIIDAANMEVPRQERFISALGTIASVAPLLGLLGTVTGNIRAFGVLGSQGVVGDPSLLASGISEALLTTAAGIIVSIPALVFYNYLVNRVNHATIRLENRVNEMLLLLGIEE